MPKKRKVKKITKPAVTIKPRRELAKTIEKVKSRLKKTRIKKTGIVKVVAGSTK